MQDYKNIINLFLVQIIFFVPVNICHAEINKPKHKDIKYDIDILKGEINKLEEQIKLLNMNPIQNTKKTPIVTPIDREVNISSIFFPGGSPRQPSTVKKTEENQEEYSRNNSKSNINHNNQNTDGSPQHDKNDSIGIDSESINSNISLNPGITPNIPNVPIKITYSASEKEGDEYLVYSYSNNDSIPKFSFLDNFILQQTRRQTNYGISLILDSINIVKANGETIELNNTSDNTALITGQTLGSSLQLNYKTKGDFKIPVFTICADKSYSYDATYPINDLDCELQNDGAKVKCYQKTTTITRDIVISKSEC